MCGTNATTIYTLYLFTIVLRCLLHVSFRILSRFSVLFLACFAPIFVSNQSSSIVLSDDIRVQLVVRKSLPSVELVLASCNKELVFETL